MLINLEKINDKEITLTFKILKEEFRDTINNIFLKTKDKYEIPGMHSGMIPRHIIEEYYGEEIFFEDTVNYLIEEEFKIMNKTYRKYQVDKEFIKNIRIIQIGKGQDLIFELLVSTNN